MILGATILLALSILTVYSPCWQLLLTINNVHCIMYLLSTSAWQALSLLFLLFASWLAYVTFEDTLQGKTMFSSYGATLYQMFVLFTTSNNPDVWIPAYK